MASFRSKPDVRPAARSSTAPGSEADALAPAVRDNWFDSSWELRHGLMVAELQDVPEDFDRNDLIAPAAPAAS